MFKKFTFFLVSVLLLAPVMVLAAPVNFGNPPAVQTNPIDANFFLNLIGKVLDLLWIVFIALAIIMFLIAGFEFLSAQGDPGGIDKARKALLWGSIGVIVAVAAFTLPFLIRNIIFPPPPAAVVPGPAVACLQNGAGCGNHGECCSNFCNVGQCGEVPGFLGA